MAAMSLFDEGDSRGTDRAGNQSPDPPDAPSSQSYAVTSSLYRKYRPVSFSAEELVGQEHVVRTLRNAIALDRVAHAYLFSGPRGTGKTTTARLLAKAINCLDPEPANRPCNTCVNCQAINAGASPDIIEIDAASNRGIDDIRDLRERVRFAPAQLPSKVYIIDEAHQITGAAANAFLKTLEEPPAHARFILATTDPEELLPTIVSRCQRFEFRRVNAEDMTRRLRTVASFESIAITDEALNAIANHATGSLRDALGLLEQLALLSAGPESRSGALDEAEVRAVLGLSNNDRLERLVDALARRDAGGALRVVQDALAEGEDPRQLNRQLVGYLRMLLLVRSGATPESDDRARSLAERFSLPGLAGLARLFSEIDFTIKHAPFPQLPLEVALVEATAPSEHPVTQDTARSAAAAQPDAPPAARTTNLRDRVRAPAPIREAPRSEGTPVARAEPVPIARLHAVESAAPAPAAAPTAGSTINVEQIVNLWPSVRADVKALNRRIEALLSEVDPVSISGNEITLAVPYPFHRDKLNSDEVRETVSGVLSRLLAREISLVCILRGEVSGVLAGSAIHEGDRLTPSAAEPLPDPDAEARAAARLRAAMNIFDAEEIDVATPEGQAVPAPDD